LALLGGSLWKSHQMVSPDLEDESSSLSKMSPVVTELDEAFATEWAEAGLTPAPPADSLQVVRRLSLALTGSIPSLEEIRALEQLPEDQQLAWWLDQTLADPRYGDYMAERMARAYVGTDVGPFIIYRRRQFVNWLSNELLANRPYSEVVRSLIASEGIWTTNPEANFITVAMERNEVTKRQDPNQVKLATRVSRAFLGVRIDCMQCHDDKFGDRWKQEDFHQLAAFFVPAENSISGVRDNPSMDYEYRYKGQREEQLVPAQVPFASELMPEEGPIRDRLAQWITHPENKPFARATVNRTWALLFGKPLVEPIDDIPLEGPWPVAMEILADDFVESGFDLQHLIRVIASSRAFQLDSRSANPDQPVTAAHEEAWACFPLTRLRPEQVAQSVIQASTLQTLDYEAHILQRLAKFGQTNDFVSRYGDAGAEELEEQAGTIPQRLLMLNGELVRERTKENVIGNAATRIGAFSDDNAQAVEMAYLAVLSRRPLQAELSHFIDQLGQKKASARSREMQDLYWALMNSTEFSWNH